MGLLDDIAAYVDGLKRNAMNTMRDTVSDPVGLLNRRLSQIAEGLPQQRESVMPGVDGGGLLSRPSMQDWGTNVALNAPTMGLLGATKSAKLDPDDYLNSRALEPPHGVRDTDKLSAIEQSMADHGWIGRPIPVYDSGNGLFALTGSHRLAAAKRTGVDVPIVYVDDVKFNRAAGKFDKSYSEILRESDDDLLQFFESARDSRIISLLRDEVKNNRGE